MSYKRQQQDGYFSQQQSKQQIHQRVLIQLDEPNPIYTKLHSQQPQISLKLIQSPKPDYISSYIPFKLSNNNNSNNNNQQQQARQQKNHKFRFESPFTQYYDAGQLIYQKYHNDAFTKFKEVRYYAGMFIPKNIIYDAIKQSSCSLEQLCLQYQQKLPKNNNISNNSINNNNSCNNNNTSINNNKTLKARRNLPQQKHKQQLSFHSNFQSGNLFAAFKVGKFQYDLVMQNDINSKGSNQWFYFSVQRMLPNVQYTFTIVNFTKKDSLFNYGMKPAYYSTVGNKKFNQGWYRFGSNVSYYKGEIQRQNSTFRYYYNLRFSIINKNTNDKIYLAHSYPYTYTKLTNYLNDIVRGTQNNHSNNNMGHVGYVSNPLAVNGHNSVLNAKVSNSNVSKISIGTTISGRQIYCLKICQKLSPKKKDQRKCIIILARQHPGETQGSYVCQGVINKLLQTNNKGNRQKEGQFLSKHFIIYVIPMVNIDGVVFGHYRANLAGKDLNRKWDVSDKQWICPEVTALKSFIADVAKQNQIKFILDLHGHSKKYGSFFYGNPCPESPEVVKIFPYICSRLNDGIQYMDCTFNCQQHKKRTARVYLSLQYKQLHVYTFQSSFYGYSKNSKIIQFTPKQYNSLGETLIQALFIQLEHEYRLASNNISNELLANGLINNMPNGPNTSTQINHSSNSKRQNISSSIPNTHYNKSPTNVSAVNSLFVKFETQLKNDQILLGVGDKDESGSDSNPEEGEINNAQVSIHLKTQLNLSSIQQEGSKTTEKSVKTTVRISSKKGTIQHKEYTRPVRNMKFLALSQVNAVLPDKYHISLQPLQRKNLVRGVKVDAECQTQINQKLPIKTYKTFQIAEKDNLVGDLQAPRRTSHSKRHSQLMSSIQKNQVFRADLAADDPLIRRRHRNQRKNTKNIFSQTIISYRIIRQAIPTKQQQEKKLVKFTTQNEARIARMEQINLQVLRVYSRKSTIVDIGVKNKQPDKEKSINGHDKTSSRNKK